MSGSSRGKKSNGKAKSRSGRYWHQFPVGRIQRLLRWADVQVHLCTLIFSRKVNYAKKVGAGAPVHMAALMENYAADILELASNTARDKKKPRIISRYLQLAIRWVVMLL